MRVTTDVVAGKRRPAGQLLTWATIIVLGTATTAHAQSASDARAAVAPSSEGHPFLMQAAHTGTHSRAGIGVHNESGQSGNVAEIRPVGTAAGALVGGALGLWVYISTADGGENLFTYSNHYFIKAVAVGAAIGLVVDVVRELRSSG